MNSLGIFWADQKLKNFSNIPFKGCNNNKKANFANWLEQIDSKEKIVKNKI
jgi:hypothetical protein